MPAPRVRGIARLARIALRAALVALASVVALDAGCGRTTIQLPAIFSQDLGPAPDLGVADLLLVDLAAPHLVQLTAHAEHTCALWGDGDLQCWGDNNHAELGEGPRAVLAPGFISGFAAVNMPDSVAQVALGEHHSCVRLRDGTIACMGDNYAGQLGNGGLGDRNVPVTIQGLENMSDVALGAWHSCARRADHTLLCWGQNDYGQLGAGGLSMRLDPVPVAGLGYDLMALGDRNTCGVRQGTVDCWGDNVHNELGVGGIIGADQPIAVTRVTSPVLQLASGALHSCALHPAGDIVCWGDNRHGQLGDGTLRFHELPVAAAGIRGAIQIALGGDHSCALMRDGGVRCWGENQDGQNGDGTQLDRPYPTTVLGLTNVAQLALGAHHSCALLNDATVRCWGKNELGQVGDNTTITRPNPTVVHVGR